MIQRQQSLWLALSTLCAILSYKFPFYTGTKIVDNISKASSLNSNSNFILLVLAGASVILSGITIFMYKDRKLQLRLCLAGAGLSLLILLVFFTQLGKFQSGALSLSCLFVFAILAGYIMAARGIWHDEKLVKTLDKLR